MVRHADESRYPVMPTAVPLLETKIFPGDLAETIGAVQYI